LRVGLTLIALLTGLLAAGAVGLAPMGDALATTSPSTTHRNMVACAYVDWTYSGLFQRPLEGYRPNAFARKVGGAASTKLRHELAYWKAAKAYENWAGVEEAGTAMVNTCDALGLSRLG
jgi:hypothetical protein